MFTGIIEAVGKVVELQQRAGDVRLRVSTGKLGLDDVALGDSIAVNGVCLTAVELPGDGFAADVSRETLSLTSLGQLKSGSPVNLEKALTLATRLGGAPGERPCRRPGNGAGKARRCQIRPFCHRGTG